MTVQAWAMVPARAVKELSPGLLRLLCVLALYRNSKTGWCWPSLKTLADELGRDGQYAETQVSKDIKTLRDMGFIDHVPGGGRKVSTYRVIYDHREPTDDEIEVEGPQDAPQGSLVAVPQGDIFGCDSTPNRLWSDHNAALGVDHKGTRRKNQNKELEDSMRETAQTKRSAKGTRLPPNWQPTEQDVAFAQGLGLSPEVLERFRDYWFSKAGAAGVKLDWSATFRNWCRSAKERGQCLAPAGTVERKPGVYKSSISL